MAKQEDPHEQPDSSASGFRISDGPVVGRGLSDFGVLPDFSELPKAYGAPLLFAIPRDPRTVFVYWNVDWSELFSKDEPIDRQVYLRLRKSDGTDELEAIVEPMLGSYYANLTEPGGLYQAELGYYSGSGNWSVVATSEIVQMPPETASENVELDLATVPFHLSFQRLIDLFRASNGNALSAIVAQLQKRATTQSERDLLSPAEWELIRAMDVSISDLQAGREQFGTDDSVLRKKTEAVLGFGATSPSNGFGQSSWGSSPAR